MIHVIYRIATTSTNANDLMTCFGFLVNQNLFSDNLIPLVLIYSALSKNSRIPSVKRSKIDLLFFTS
ncbi:MAG: hypothetical protein CM15mP59_2190 [Flavobacteriaceae bacterium]|nr:MAG: hypothetical protein CM15mP59_2190 [Flavobacteriaceae bacterium]